MAAPPRWPPAGPQISLAAGDGAELWEAALPAFLYQRLQTPALLQEPGPRLRKLGVCFLFFFFPLSLFLISFSSFLFTLQVRGKGCKSGIWSSVFLTPSPVRPGFDTAFER